MIIIHVVRQFAPGIGGLEDAVGGLVRAQRADGIDARVVTLNRIFTHPHARLRAQETIGGIPVTRIPWLGSSRYPLAPGVLGAIRDADLVHVHAIDFFFDFLAFTRPLHGKRLVATTHGGFFHTGRFGLIKRAWFATITRLTVPAYAALIACSDSDAARFAPLAGARLHTIENGVDLDKFARPPEPRHPRRLIHVGRFASHKRIELLFPLLAALRRRNPDWHLVIAGSEGDVPLAHLRRAAAAAGLEPHVRFMLRPSQAELAAELAQASIFAAPSADEGFGLAAVEAAAAGLVPALSDISPFARLLRRLGAGALFDPADPETAADRIEALPTDPATRAAIMRAAGSYGWRRPADAIQAVYRSVTSTGIPQHAPA
jgi:alpha-1,3-mannosyltransferase